MNLVRALPGYLMESGNGNQYSPEEFDKIEDSVLSETESIIWIRSRLWKNRNPEHRK